MLDLYLKELISVVKVKWKRRFFVLRGSLINGRVSFGILWHNVKKKTCVKKTCIGKMCVNMKRKTCSKTCVNIFAKFSQCLDSYQLTGFVKFWCYKNNRIIRYRIIVNLSWENLAKIFLAWCLFYKAVQLFLLKFSRIRFDLSHY